MKWFAFIWFTWAALFDRFVCKILGDLTCAYTRLRYSAKKRGSILKSYYAWRESHWDARWMDWLERHETNVEKASLLYSYLTSI